MFDDLTSSKLGFYVYALVNPITGKVFYIGKGIANRVFAHVQEKAYHSIPGSEAAF